MNDHAVRQSDMEAASQSETVRIVSNTGFCVDCADQPAVLTCDQCLDDYCLVCFGALHRKGARSKHTYTELAATIPSATNPFSSEAQNIAVDVDEDEDDDKVARRSITSPIHRSVKESFETAAAIMKKQKMGHVNTSSLTIDKVVASSPSMTTSSSEFTEEELQGVPEDVQPYVFKLLKFRANYLYLPVRLSDSERRMLHILEEAINVSEFTDKVDIYHGDRSRRFDVIVREIETFLYTLAALYVTHDFRIGRREIFAAASASSSSSHRDHPLSPLAELFQRIIEIGRRNKIRNPDKMRTTYGKLMHLLMDAQTPEVQRYFGFTLIIPIRTAHIVLTETIEKLLVDLPTAKRPKAGAEKIASAVFFDSSNDFLYGCSMVRSTPSSLGENEDELIDFSSRTITPAISARALRWRTLRKNRFYVKFTSEDSPLGFPLPLSVLEEVTGALSDATAYVGQTIMPIQFLKSLVDPVGESIDLSVRSGLAKARISHTHIQQISFVSQTFRLWKDIAVYMIHLWFAADEDMLNPQNRYQLRNTGQGLNRMQYAPKVASIMHNLVSSLGERVTKSGERWVGSSAVHLGDESVPNALVFIDKYCQVERITAPLMSALCSIASSAAQGKIIAFNYRRSVIAVHEYYLALSKTQKQKANRMDEEEDETRENEGSDESASKNPTEHTKVEETMIYLHKLFQKLKKDEKETETEGEEEDMKALSKAISTKIGSNVSRITSTTPRESDSMDGLLSRIAYARWVNTYVLSRDDMLRLKKEPLSERIQQLIIKGVFFPGLLSTAMRRLELMMPLISLTTSLKKQKLPHYVLLSYVFKHGFNGSGEPNATAMTAGSCIDGRLTSLWEFCNSIEKTAIYHALLVGGFTGFDSTF